MRDETRERLSHRDLSQAPELAVLVALRATLGAAAVALLSEHPELCWDDTKASAEGTKPVTWLADEIILRCQELTRHLDRYRGLALAIEADSDTPF